MSAADPAPSLARRLAVSTRRWMVLKALGTTAFMWGFFALYFHLLRHPSGPVTVMPVTALDRAMPFVPWALWLYFSLWVYVCLPPSLIRDFGRLVRYGLWMVLACAIGLFIFWRWPTAVAPMTEAVGDHPGFGILKGVDAAGNAFPSLHVATAVISMFWLDRMLREHGAGTGLRAAGIAWGLGIVLSTMAVRQHGSWDVAGGIVLAAAVIALSWRSLRTPCPVPGPSSSRPG